MSKRDSPRAWRGGQPRRRWGNAPISAAVVAVISVGATIASRARTGRMEEFRGLNLRRVLAVDNQPGEGDLRLLAVEFYEDGLALRWVIATVGPPEEQTQPGYLEAPVFIVSDDVGTAYRQASGHSGGAETRLAGTSEFLPVVPVKAGRLVVTGGRPASGGVEWVFDWVFDMNQLEEKKGHFKGP